MSLRLFYRRQQVQNLVTIPTQLPGKPLDRQFKPLSRRNFTGDNRITLFSGGADGTHSECDAATHATSAANCPRSLQ